MGALKGKYDEDGFTSKTSCSSEERIGGATKFASGVSCKDMPWYQDVQEDKDIEEDESFLLRVQAFKSFVQQKEDEEKQLKEQKEPNSKSGQHKISPALWLWTLIL